MGFTASHGKTFWDARDRKARRIPLPNLFFVLNGSFQKTPFLSWCHINVLRLHIQNFSNHLVPSRVTTMAQAKRSEETSYNNIQQNSTLEPQCEHLLCSCSTELKNPSSVHTFQDIVKPLLLHRAKLLVTWRNPRIISFDRLFSPRFLCNKNQPLSCVH